MERKYRLLVKNSRYEYYITNDGYMARKSKKEFTELGYIEDNLPLYKRLCEQL